MVRSTALDIEVLTEGLSSESVYSKRKQFHIVFTVCLHSLLLSNSNPAFCLPSPWQEIFDSLGSWTGELWTVHHNSSRCSCAHQKATSRSEAKRWVISQIDGLSSVSHHDSALPNRMAFADHAFGLTASTAFLSEHILNLCPPYLCDSIVFHTMQAVEKFTQLLQCMFPKVSEK